MPWTSWGRKWQKYSEEENQFLLAAKFDCDFNNM